MGNFEWAEGLPSAITVSDENAIVIYMNPKSIETFANDGGVSIIGQSLYDCHNENSCRIIREILNSGIPNTYTIEKNGAKKLIHQAPWFKSGNIAGLVEISIVLPDPMNHFIRS